MRKIGLVAGVIALFGLVLLTILPVLMTYHLEDTSGTCLVACLASDSILGRAGYLPEIMTVALAGFLIGALYMRSRRGANFEEDEVITDVCKYCGKEINHQWMVCPFCGQSTVTKD